MNTASAPVGERRLRWRRVGRFAAVAAIVALAIVGWGRWSEPGQAPGSVLDGAGSETTETPGSSAVETTTPPTAEPAVPAEIEDDRPDGSASVASPSVQGPDGSGLAIAGVLRNGVVRVWGQSGAQFDPWKPADDVDGRNAVGVAGSASEVFVLLEDGSVVAWAAAAIPEDRLSLVWVPAERGGVKAVNLVTNEVGMTVLLGDDGWLYDLTEADNSVVPLWSRSETTRVNLVAAGDLIVAVSAGSTIETFDPLSGEERSLATAIGAPLVDAVGASDHVLVVDGNGSVWRVGVGDADEVDKIWDANETGSAAVASASTEDRYYIVLRSGDVASTDDAGLSEVFWDASFGGEPLVQSISATSDRVVVQADGGTVAVYDESSGLTEFLVSPQGRPGGGVQLVRLLR